MLNIGNEKTISNKCKDSDIIGHPMKGVTDQKRIENNITNIMSERVTTNRIEPAKLIQVGETFRYNITGTRERDVFGMLKPRETEERSVMERITNLLRQCTTAPTHLLPKKRSCTVESDCG